MSDYTCSAEKDLALVLCPGLCLGFSRIERGQLHQPNRKDDQDLVSFSAPRYPAQVQLEGTSHQNQTDFRSFMNSSGELHQPQFRLEILTSLHQSLIQLPSN